MAETLEKSIIRQTPIQASNFPGYKHRTKPDTSIELSPIQASDFPGYNIPAKPDLPGAVIIDVQAFQVASENTAETTSKTTGETTTDMATLKCIKEVPPPKNLVEEKNAGGQGLELQPDPQGEHPFKLVRDTQEVPRPEEEYRATPKDPHEGKFSAAADAPNFEGTPQWVQELEEKVRRGLPVKREKLIALANYRLGDLVGLYRQ